MNHKAYIRFINTHSKRNRSYNHINVFLQESILIPITGSRIHSCMISASLDTICQQYFSELFHLLTAQAIDNT